MAKIENGLDNQLSWGDFWSLRDDHIGLQSMEAANAQPSSVRFQASVYITA